MAATYDLSTNVGMVRLLIQDTDTTNAIFTDEEITAFLDMADDSVNGAASKAFLATAGSNSRLAKMKKIGGYTHDLTSLARECREQAAVFRGLEESEPASGFVEWPVTTFARRDIRLRGEYE